MSRRRTRSTLTLSRRGQVLVGLVATAAILSACGGGDNKTASPTTTAGGAAGAPNTTGAPTGGPTTAAGAPGGSTDDRAVAEGAVLRQSDLSAWQAKAHEERPDDPDVEGQLATCMGVDPSMLKTENASTVHSPDFESPRGGNFEVQNSVSLVASATMAQERIAVLERAETPGCLSTAMSEIMRRTIQNPRSGNAAPPGLTVGEVSAQVQPFPALGDGTVAFQVAIPLQAEGEETTVHGLLVFAIKGRGATAFTLLGYGSPFPLEEAERLATVVVDRLPAS